MEYKARHEDFVSGLSGSTVKDIYVVSAVFPVLYVAWWYVSRQVTSATASYLIDFIFNWALGLAAVTLYSGNVYVLIALLLVPIALSPKTAVPAPQSPTADPLPKKPFITVYRATMIILTVTAILAVDFSIFPRRFAKVETWGTSLMDLGVGSFVFSMGVVSARSTLKASLEGTQTKFSTKFTNALRHSSKLLVLGLVRLAAVKYLNYQEHESEYGTHWNFFMTLGLLPPFVVVLQTLILRIPMLVVGVLVALVYEIILKNTGLLEWALTAQRVNVVTHNKEGICSFFGYLAIFLIGQSVGYYILPNTDAEVSFLFPPTKRQTKKPTVSAKGSGKILKLLVFETLLFHGLYALFQMETPVSRRLANLPYILWVCGYNTGVLALYAAVESLVGGLPSMSHESVNNHGQKIFLLGNVLTGLVNISFHTIDMGKLSSLALLVAYLGAIYVASAGFSKLSGPSAKRSGHSAKRSGKHSNRSRRDQKLEKA